MKIAHFKDAMKKFFYLLSGLFLTSTLFGGCGGGGRGGSAPASTSPKWTGTKQLGVASGNTQANQIAVDKNGNVYVAGSTTGGLDGNALSGTGSQDFFLTMYSSTGNKIRTKQLGVAGKFTVANAVAVAADGNVYVVGSTNGNLDGNTIVGNQDFFLTIYDSTGNKKFTKQLGAGTATTIATGVAVDRSGNVYVTGYTNGSLDGNTIAGNRDLFLTMYDQTGAKIRTRQLGVISKTTTATGVAVDSNYNVYVTGSTNGLMGATLTGLNDFFLTKYDSTGLNVGTQQLGVAGYVTVATSVSIDANNNVYVAGYTLGGLDGNSLTGRQDFFITKYDPLGVKQ